MYLVIFASCEPLITNNQQLKYTSQLWYVQRRQSGYNMVTAEERLTSEFMPRET